MFLEIKQLQEHSDLICEHFGMKKIPVVVNNRLTRTLGLWCGGDRIELNPETGRTLETLRHELAHHLQYARYEQRKEGYVKMEMWPAMVLDSIDANGQKWYAAKGKPEPVYLRLGTMHGKLFKECLKEIEEKFCV